jgi:hypothetical protein
VGSSYTGAQQVTVTGEAPVDEGPAPSAPGGRQRRVGPVRRMNPLPAWTGGLVGDRDPAQPLLTLYDGPARVELSGVTTANWVAKSANLLVDGLDRPRDGRPAAAAALAERRPAAGGGDHRRHRPAHRRAGRAGGATRPSRSPSAPRWRSRPVQGRCWPCRDTRWGRRADRCRRWSPTTRARCPSYGDHWNGPSPRPADRGGRGALARCPSWDSDGGPGADQHPVGRGLPGSVGCCRPAGWGGPGPGARPHCCRPGAGARDEGVTATYGLVVAGLPRLSSGGATQLTSPPSLA